MKLKIGKFKIWTRKKVGPSFYGKKIHGKSQEHFFSDTFGPIKGLQIVLNTLWNTIMYQRSLMIIFAQLNVIVKVCHFWAQVDKLSELNALIIIERRIPPYGPNSKNKLFS